MVFIDFFVLFILFISYSSIFFFFFFNDTATTEIYTLSLHDALPIYRVSLRMRCIRPFEPGGVAHAARACALGQDRKSTRLNSSHSQISYAVFCLKKKKKTININTLLISLVTNAYYQLSCL